MRDSWVVQSPCVQFQALVYVGRTERTDESSRISCRRTSTCTFLRTGKRHGYRITGSTAWVRRRTAGALAVALELIGLRWHDTGPAPGSRYKTRTKLPAL